MKNSLWLSFLFVAACGGAPRPAPDQTPSTTEEPCYGTCGWTQTKTLTECLANPPAE